MTQNKIGLHLRGSHNKYKEYTPVQVAWQNGDKESVLDYVTKGFYQVNDKSHGNSLLHNAVTDNAELVVALIKAGANVNARNYHQQTPMHHKMSPEVVEPMIAAGAKLDVINRYDETPLITAILYSDQQTTVRMLKHCKNISCRLEHKSWPHSSRDAFQLAVEYGKNEVAAEFVKQGLGDICRFSNSGNIKGIIEELRRSMSEAELPPCLQELSGATLNTSLHEEL